MPDKSKSASLLTLDTFGDLLKYLRRRAQLTQRELAISVGYSEAHVSRLEKNQRLPDLATLAALFVPALGLEDEPDAVARLLELAATARGEKFPASGKLTIMHSIEDEVVETITTVEIPGNLPLQLTSFIGREAEIEEIKRFLQGVNKIRLLSLVGAGGCGKTRLALQVAEQVVLGYPDGVWFIDLAPLTDPNLITSATASTLGIQETPGQELTTNLIAFLRPKKILILFDNCEHILTVVSDLIELLLRACPHLQALATSREVLNIQGEKQFHVTPLPYPPEENVERNLIGEFDAVRLFIQRARNVQSSFDLTDENASYVARVCRRLDGIPLAIELAAARVGLLRVQQIDSQLNDRFNLLTTGGRTLPRHQTLRGMLDWSHHLLSEEERKFFRRLSVFAGGWTLEAADVVVNETKQTFTLEFLSNLVNKSFIVTERDPGMEARYSMLETIREYSFDKLEAAQEKEPTRAKHFEYFYNLACAARLYGSEKQVWLDRLETDYDNIRAAVAWVLTSGAGQPYIEKAIGLVLSIVDFFWFRGFTAEAREWMDKFIELRMPASSLRALLLQKAGWFARGSGDFKKADVLLHRALEMAREIGDKNRASWALGDLGLSARDQGNSEQAISYFSEGLAFARESGEKRAIGVCLYNLAECYELAGNLDTSISFWEQGLTIFREERDKTHIGWGLEGLAGTAFLARDFAGALRFHLESLKIKVEVMDKLGLAYSFEGLAQVAATEEEPERAAVLWGAAHHLREAMNTPLDPSREDIYTSLIPTTREQIGDKLFDEAWKKGEAMNLEDAIQYALQGYSG